MPTVTLHTLGCKLNHAETAMIGKQFLDRGFTVVGPDTPSDVFVLNTCSVTERAERECRQLIRRILRKSTQTVVVVTGCYAQLRPEEIASIDGVDVVLGTKEKFSLFDHVETLDKEACSPRVYVSEIDRISDFGPAYSTDAANRTRAFLKVQDGCDFNCSFCTIPMARGASRSQSIEVCVAQTHQLVASGYKEVVLTGVNVGDYGKKMGSSFLELLEQLVLVNGLYRIRISSIEPNLLNARLLDFIAEEPRICKHFHIPLQSGHDDILRAMRRRYTSRYYRDLILRVKHRIPLCCIGVDVIVGFPGETKAHFEATCALLTELPVSYLHVFTYSERPNTPAASYGNKVDARARGERNEVLRLLSRKKRAAFYREMVGRKVSVLLESEVESGLRFGLTENYVKVGVPVSETVENMMVLALIDEARDKHCLGTILDSAEVI